MQNSNNNNLTPEEKAEYLMQQFAGDVISAIVCVKEIISSVPMQPEYNSKEPKFTLHAEDFWYCVLNRLEGIEELKQKDKA